MCSAVPIQPGIPSPAVNENQADEKREAEFIVIDQGEQRHDERMSDVSQLQREWLPSTAQHSPAMERATI